MNNETQLISHNEEGDLIALPKIEHGFYMLTPTTQQPRDLIVQVLSTVSFKTSLPPSSPAREVMCNEIASNQHRRTKRTTSHYFSWSTEQEMIAV